MIGMQDDEVKDLPGEWLNRVHPEDRGKLEKDLDIHIKGYSAHFENEHRLLHKDGIYRWMHVRGIAVRDMAGEAYRIAGSVTDITGRKQVEQRLTFDALHDSLTGLPNRALFMDRLGHAIDREKRNKNYLFAVLFMDIDRIFKLSSEFACRCIEN